MRPKNIVSLSILLVVVFVAGVLFATAGANLFERGESVATASEAAVQAAEEKRPSQRLELEEAFIEVAAVINPSVVQIRSEHIMEQSADGSPFDGTPLEGFFGDPDLPQRRRGLGSGVIIRSDGYIITNNHVVQQADELEVALYDGRFFEATVVGADQSSDLAVIRIDADDLPAVPFGSASKVRVGQWVLAFGSPMSEDLDNTVTAGIVSALGRTSQDLSRINPFAAFIQTDAAINPGNSGGPLVDLRGQLIGINSAIYSRMGVNQGIGFAIPVNVVDNVITQLIENGSVERGFLGVAFDNVPRALAEALDTARGAAQVTEVIANSAAHKAGIREGDIITAVNGRTLSDHNQLRTIIGNMRPGEEVTLDVARDNERLSLSIRLGLRTDELALSEPVEREEQNSATSLQELGLTLGDITSEALRRKLSLDKAPALSGVFVEDVDRNSPAFREAELRPNDIITEVNKKPVRSIADLERIYADLPEGKTFIVKVMRHQVDDVFRPFFSALTKPY